MIFYAALSVFACGGGDDAKKPVEAVDTAEEAVDCVPSVWYEDADGDGYGDPFTEALACDAPDSYVDNYDDCNDEDEAERPDAVWYRDVDGDGYGDADAELNTCMKPMGYIMDAGDCDDMDGTRYPGARWYVDADNDGFGAEDRPIDACGSVEGAVPQVGDCDDDDWLTHPDANEVCDERDNDCDGQVDSLDPDIDLFTQVLMFEDADGDGYGTEVAVGYACASEPVGATVVGDCDDTNPEIHPNRIDYFDDVDSDCDGEVALHIASRSTVGWISDMTGSAFGVSGSSKDIDGDGKNEVLVGAYNVGDHDEGGVRYFPGNITGDLMTFPEEARAWNANVPDARAGFTATFVGDWDGDGIEDIVAGAPYDAGRAGMAYLFSSEMESTELASGQMVSGTAEEETWFGYAVLGVGDVNGDALDDVLIAARKDGAVRSNGGSLGLLYGGDTEREIIATEDTIYSESNGDQLGFAMADVGDPDGDGVPNYLVGAPYCEAEGVPGNAGCTFLFAQTDLGVGLTTPEGIPMFWAEQGSAGLGFSIAAAGDFNGDGLDDMLMGAQNHDVVEDDEGAVYLMLGRTDGWGTGSVSEAHLVMYGSDVDDKMGRYMNRLGDIDADGTTDIGVVIHNSSLYESKAGAVFGILGGRESGTILVQEDADFVMVGGTTNDYLGRAIFPAGDVDEDGYDDFWLGASGASSYGAMYLMSGIPRPTD